MDHGTYLGVFWQLRYFDQLEFLSLETLARPILLAAYSRSRIILGHFFTTVTYALSPCTLRGVHSRNRYHTLREVYALCGSMRTHVETLPTVAHWYAQHPIGAGT